ncbi:hypothetical protein NUH87_31005 [Pseudomonas batumici]|uniref:hypothetical protein n=1 Tax=Pseudomonas batumici TaxID=226910 RepID=UPI0030CAC8FD
MSKTIELKPGAKLSGVLVKRRDILRLRAAEDVLVEARKRARKLCDEAQREASAIRGNGYLEGYAEGLNASVVALVNEMIAIADVREYLEQSLALRIKELLLPSFASNDMLLAVVEQLLQSEPLPAVKQLRVFLPAFAKGESARIEARLVAAGLSVKVAEAPDGQRFVIEWGEHVWSFEAPAALDKVVSSSIASLHEHMDLEAGCGRLRAQVFEELAAQLSACVVSVDE